MLLENIDDLKLKDFLPQSELVLPEHPVERPRFPAIDAHNHLGGAVRQGPEARHYRIVYRFLETDDEYFPYSIAPLPIKGRWRIYGLFLPDDVLRKVYVENAVRLIPGVG